MVSSSLAESTMPLDGGRAEEVVVVFVERTTGGEMERVFCSWVEDSWNAGDGDIGDVGDSRCAPLDSTLV
jgi:hypothetical protein